MVQRPFHGFKGPRKKRASPEHGYQKAVIDWANANVEHHPSLHYLYANANGGERHVLIAVQMKEEGVKPGVPDLTLPIPRGGYHGLYIEMKADKGSESEDQKRWLAFLKAEGYYVATSYGSEIAIQILEQYLAWPPTRVVSEDVWNQLSDHLGVPRAIPRCKLAASVLPLKQCRLLEGHEPPCVPDDRPRILKDA